MPRCVTYYRSPSPFISTSPHTRTRALARNGMYMHAYANDKKGRQKTKYKYSRVGVTRQNDDSAIFQSSYSHLPPPRYPHLHLLSHLFRALPYIFLSFFLSRITPRQ
mmetsp:Transcript_37954/g.97961  ORF Transcript_37954/g.97961 Transcript_37954/m.97961 type:complete len:107 (+) Transcript_37954:115-435(+)